MNRRRFLQSAGTVATASLGALAGCGESPGEWWAVLQTVDEREPVLASATIQEPGSLLGPATVSLIPISEKFLCRGGLTERHYIITVTGDSADGDEIAAWIHYEHNCTPNSALPTFEADSGTYRVLVNSGGVGGPYLAEYELQVSGTQEYNEVSGSR